MFPANVEACTLWEFTAGHMRLHVTEHDVTRDAPFVHAPIINVDPAELIGIVVPNAGDPVAQSLRAQLHEALVEWRRHLPRPHPPRGLEAVAADPYRELGERVARLRREYRAAAGFED